MIVVQVTDASLRKAVVRAAHPEEDVVVDRRLAAMAFEFGFPRLVVRDRASARPEVAGGMPVLDLDEVTLRRWEVERRMQELPPTRLDYQTDRLRRAMEPDASSGIWVDRALADLSRAAGARLPLSLRTFGRRVLEFPIHYTTLHPLATACGASRGALKARFRRRDLTSPSTYLRWFRMMAVADVLSDRSVTVASAARRLGFTSDGNLCRMMLAVTGLTPTEARTLRGWNRLLITFAWQHLSADDLERWATLDELFERRVA
jgi:AraC-like DNA-binding protein